MILARMSLSCAAMRHHPAVSFVGFMLLAIGCAQHAGGEPQESANSIGIPLVRIEPGSFDMGVDSVPLPAELTKGVSGASWDRPDGNGDYDEVPVHRVTIAQPLLIGQTEVTVEQFLQFRPDYQRNAYWSPYASGVSWKGLPASP